jgi:RNA:NAD 2'-phosphotransferase (TPT1/KptA family)
MRIRPFFFHESHLIFFQILKGRSLTGQWIRATNGHHGHSVAATRHKFERASRLLPCYHGSRRAKL